MSGDLSCIRCEKQMRNYLDRQVGFQPEGGLAFFTHGHYGSAHFDPMDGRSYLELCVCDDCVKAMEEAGNVRRKDHRV